MPSRATVSSGWLKARSTAQWGQPRAATGARGVPRCVDIANGSHHGPDCCCAATGVRRRVSSEALRGRARRTARAARISIGDIPRWAIIYIWDNAPSTTRARRSTGRTGIIASVQVTCLRIAPPIVSSHVMPRHIQQPEIFRRAFSARRCACDPRAPPRRRGGHRGQCSRHNARCTTGRSWEPISAATPSS